MQEWEVDAGESLKDYTNMGSAYEHSPRKTPPGGFSLLKNIV